MKEQDELPLGGQLIVAAGALVGLLIAGAVIFCWSVGMLPAVFLGMAGPALGIMIARPIALAVTKRKP